jgi:flagellar FliJ protein
LIDHITTQSDRHPLMFRFPLQRILDLKAKREEEIARELAAARTAADEAKRAHDTLAAAHDAGRQQLASRPAPTVGEMRTLSIVLGHLQEHVAAAALENAAAEAAVAQVHSQLTTALQERRVLDKLRERRLEAHQAEAAAKDRQTMDAIALTRFAHRDTKDTNTNTTDRNHS